MQRKTRSAQNKLHYWCFFSSFHSFVRLAISSHFLTPAEACPFIDYVMFFFSFSLLYYWRISYISPHLYLIYTYVLSLNWYFSRNINVGVRVFFFAGMLISIINNAARPLESKHTLSHRHTSDLFPKTHPWLYCEDHILFSQTHLFEIGFIYYHCY